MFHISNQISIPDSEIEVSQVRAQGPGGQNVNKVSNAVHLRFDIPASSLPEACKQKLLRANDQRISSDGIMVIKAQRFRSLERNRQDAYERLAGAIRQLTAVHKRRIATRPSVSSRKKRLEQKNLRGQIKTLRGKPEY